MAKMGKRRIYTSEWLPYALVAFGLAAIAIFSLLYSVPLGRLSAQSDISAMRAKEASNSLAQKACAELTSTKEIRDCLSSILPIDRTEERAEAELTIQSEVATWTRSMVWISVLSLISGTAGILLVAWTLRATLRANDLSRDQSRAWISVTVNQGNDLAFSKDLSTRAVFEILLHNYGNSAAHNFVIGYRMLSSSTKAENIEKFHTYIENREKADLERDLYGRALATNGVYSEHFEERRTAAPGEPFWEVLFVSVIYSCNGSELVHHSAYMFDMLVLDDDKVLRICKPISPGQTIQKAHVGYRQSYGTVAT